MALSKKKTVPHQTGRSWSNRWLKNQAARWLRRQAKRLGEDAPKRVPLKGGGW